jgi:hypothetical protein
MTYLPFQDFYGSDSFVYAICDSTGACDMATVSVNLSPVADPPAANDDHISTEKATPVTVDVAANDSDPEGDLVQSSANTDCPDCSPPANGILDNNYDGTFTYTPYLNFTGSDSFIYQICDSGSRCDIAFVLIEVSKTVKYFNFLPVTSNGR